VTPTAEVLVDPVGVVVDLVVRVEPALARATVVEVVTAVAGGRVTRRRLAAGLAQRPALLVDGRSPAPRVVGDLLVGLRTAGAVTISPPRCTDCGKGLRTFQRRGQDWFCSVCGPARQRCVRCGITRRVGFRDRQGRPRCGGCPPDEDGDPIQLVVEVVAAVDPMIPAERVADAVVAVTSRAGQRRQLAWALQDRPGLLTGEGAHAPVPSVLRLIDVLSEAGAAAIVRPACPHCGRVVALSKIWEGRRVCRNCEAKARAEPCIRCGVVRQPASRDGDGQPLCPNCLVGDPINLEDCVACGRRRRVNTRGPDGPICGSCTPRAVATCSVCGRTVGCTTSRATGQPWCGACARAWVECSQCRRWATLRAGTRDAPLCAGCAVDDPGFWKACSACHASGRLTAGVCDRCRLQRQLDGLLADPGGQIRPGLQALHDTLVNHQRPATVRRWLATGTTATLLRELGTTDRPLTHDALDQLTPSKPVEHLRSVLVATGTLPARDEQLARIQRWVIRTLDEHATPDSRELLDRYAVWHLLRRVRQRNRDTEATYEQLDLIRQRVRAAIGLLDWLARRGLTLPTCRQGDLEAWLTSSDVSHRAETGHFVRWAIAQKINPDLQFAASRWTGPTGPLDHDERWQQARRLLHDDTLDTDDRVAGLLVLLYAQRAAAIARLTIDDVDIGQATVTLRLGSVPVVLPEPLASLVCDLVATRRGHASIGVPATSPWLFPGGQPGRPVSADRLGQRLRLIGLRPAQARSTALFQLATELPAALLARMLGIHVKVAVAWQHVSAGDWTAYAADVSRRPHSPQVL
jgi:hypothetical protein